jgi:carbon-monoxide dehydrogenase large subunit
VAERSEAFLSDHQARDNIARVELALDAGGRFLGLRVRATTNLGAYLAASGVHCAVNNLGGLSGVYATPAIHAEATGVFTNTNPTAAYRGAGRPEAAFMIERAVDEAARKLGLDPAELRARNLIAPSAMPYKTGFVYTYDCGEFAATQAEALKLADWAGFPARRAAAKARGRLRGIGMANVVENAGGLTDELGEIRFDASGTATILVGTHNHGQGQETTFRQLAAGMLGLDPDKVEVQLGDSDSVVYGRGSFGSRAATVVSVALGAAAEKIVAKGKKIAAHALEAAEADIEFAQGRFAVAGTDRAIALPEIARLAHVPARLPRGMEAGLAERAITVSDGPTFPNGAHVCEVEIDPETGALDMIGYWVVEDVGRAVNPAIVYGQVHGGVAQGVGQVLCEAIVHDPDSGQPLTGSFMDYGIPRASDLPRFDVHSHAVLTKKNPLGIKGAGEGGTVGAIPAVMNAVCDALRPAGVTDFTMPATPARVWQALQRARAG